MTHFFNSYFFLKFALVSYCISIDTEICNSLKKSSFVMNKNGYTYFFVNFRCCYELWTHIPLCDNGKQMIIDILFLKLGLGNREGLLPALFLFRQ